MDRPVVSVVMPVYNGGQWLLKAIKSILNQTYRDFELIIVNDGSTDNTASILSSITDNRVRLITFTSNQGIVVALNKGIQESSGTYIVRMDADDIALPTRIERQIAFMESHPEVGVLGTQFKCIGGRSYQLPLAHETICWHLLTANPFIHSSVCLRKSVLEKLDTVYQKQAAYCEDLDLWMRLCSQTKLANLPDKLQVFRKHYATHQRNRDAIAKISKELQLAFAQKLLPRLEGILIEQLIQFTNRYQLPYPDLAELIGHLTQVSAILNEVKQPQLNQVCNQSLYYHFAVTPSLYLRLKAANQVPSWYQQPFYANWYLQIKAMLKKGATFV